MTTKPITCAYLECFGIQLNYMSMIFYDPKFGING